MNGLVRPQRVCDPQVENHWARERVREKCAFKRSQRTVFIRYFPELQATSYFHVLIIVDLQCDLLMVVTVCFFEHSCLITQLSDHLSLLLGRSEHSP